MIINEKRQLTDDEFNSLTWSDIPINSETLSEVFSGKTIISAETIDFPNTDGIIYALLDGEQLVFVETSIDDNLLYGNYEECERPLFLRVSEPVTPSPA